MSIDWDWPGARWWKFDFHTHTPASRDYLNGNEELKSQVSPETWLLAFMRAGIDCVAVTDHNSGAWIDQLKSALAEMESEKSEGFRPIHLFPGVEISVNSGVHLLAIFGSEKTAADIDSLLGAVGFSGSKGDSDACTGAPGNRGSYRESFSCPLTPTLSLSVTALALLLIPTSM